MNRWKQRLQPDCSSISYLMKFSGRLASLQLTNNCSLTLVLGWDRHSLSEFISLFG